MNKIIYPWKKYKQCPNSCAWLSSGYCLFLEVWNHNGKSEIYPADNTPCAEKLKLKLKK